MAEWLRQRAHDPRVMGSNPGAATCGFTHTHTHIYIYGASEDTRKIVSLVLGPQASKTPQAPSMRIWP